MGSAWLTSKITRNKYQIDLNLWRTLLLNKSIFSCIVTNKLTVDVCADRCVDPRRLLSDQPADWWHLDAGAQVGNQPSHTVLCWGAGR